MFFLFVAIDFVMKVLLDGNTCECFSSCFEVFFLVVCFLNLLKLCLRFLVQCLSIKIKTKTDWYRVQNHKRM